MSLNVINAQTPLPHRQNQLQQIYKRAVINCRDQVKHTEQTPENIPSAGFCQSLIGAISKRLHTSITATIGTQLAQTLAVNMFACICQKYKKHCINPAKNCETKCEKYKFLKNATN